MISDTIKYIGVDDLDIDLFESQYVVPEGMSYNSYLIDDEENLLSTYQQLVRLRRTRKSQPGNKTFPPWEPSSPSLGPSGEPSALR